MHLPVGVLGQTNPAGLRHAFEPRGDVDAVAHEIAVALLDHVANVDSDAKFDAALRRKVGVASDHRVLHFVRAADRVHDAAELDDRPVPGALDDPAVMRGDGRVDQVGAQFAEPRKRALFVGAGQPAIADDVGH